MQAHAGELAALGTAVCWTLTVLSFAAAGRRVGSLSVNFIRLLMAFAILAALEAIVRGRALPLDASLHAWTWLAISGVVGFAIGDLCLFRALLLIGPRLASLIMSMAPPITALIGWLVLGETLGALQIGGMALSVAGIAWAINDRSPGSPEISAVPPGQKLRGIALAVLGATGQAGGLVLSKFGMGSYDPFAATQIRIVAGAAAFAVIFTATGWWPRVGSAVRDPGAMGYTLLGAIFGPFLGVSLSLIAVQRTEAGVAASIMATSPIIIIPIVVLLHKERVGLGGLLGACLAVAGVALLFQ